MSHTKENKIFKEKGISIFLSLLILTVLLSLALGLSTILVGQIRMIKRMGDSVISFFAADTGIERILYEDKMCRLPGCNDLAWSCLDTVNCDDGLAAGTLSDSLGEATYQVDFNDGATSTLSKGIYRETQRAAQVTR